MNSKLKILTLLATIFFMGWTEKQALPDCSKIRNDSVVVPGVRVGKLTLGMERRLVERLIGRPIHSTSLGRDAEAALYASGGGENFLGLYYENNKIRTIEYNSPQFKTADCRDLRSSKLDLPWIDGYYDVDCAVIYDSSDKYFSDNHSSCTTIGSVLNAMGSSALVPNWKAAKRIPESEKTFFLVPVQQITSWGKVHSLSFDTGHVYYLFEEGQSQEPIIKFEADILEFAPAEVEIKDVNADGFSDLIWSYLAGACGVYTDYEIYVYDPGTENFNNVLYGRAPRFNEEKGEIHFMNCSNCACSAYGEELYKWQNGKFEKIYEKEVNLEEEDIK